MLLISVAKFLISNIIGHFMSRRGGFAGTAEVRYWCNLVCGFNGWFLIHVHSRRSNHPVSVTCA